MAHYRTSRLLTAAVVAAFACPALADEYDDTVRCFYMLEGAMAGASDKNVKELNQLDVELRKKIVRIRPNETEDQALKRMDAVIARVDGASQAENLKVFLACAASFAIDLRFP